MRQEDLKTRYSNSELAEFKELLSKRLRIEEETLEGLSSSLSSTNDNNDDRRDSTHDVDKENVTTLISRSKRIIEQLNAALRRVGNKTYGICINSGNLIPKERLIAMPTATFCIEPSIQPGKKLVIAA